MHTVVLGQSGTRRLVYLHVKHTGTKRKDVYTQSIKDLSSSMRFHM